VIKVVLQFRSAFWEKVEGGRYADAAFFHSPSAAFPTFWTSLPLRTTLLCAWAAGPRAARLSGATESTIVRAALDSLGTVFGAEVCAEQELAAAYLHDWQADAFAFGAYSYVIAGARRAREALAAPLDGTLLFAGEAADSGGESGTVAGALESGKRAAREALDPRTSARAAAPKRARRRART
jgi:monoamine oxidase